MVARCVFWLLLAAAAITGGCGRSSAPTNNNDPAANESPMLSSESTGRVTSFYTVAKYDPQADPAADLESTVAKATAEGKRIIIEIGGQW